MIALMTHEHADTSREKTQDESLVLRKTGVASALSLNVRTIERMISAGRFPAADAWAGKCPLWRRSTIENWIDSGGSR
jgi:predicted DNA-binding transcriptional regulator AlpA